MQVSAETGAAEGWRPGPVTVWAVPNLILVALFLVRFHVGVWAQDEGQLLVYSERLAEGAVPWRDFETVYGVLHLWVLRGAYAIGGWNLETMRIVGILFGVVFVCGVVAVARKRADDATALLAGSVAAVVLGTMQARPAAWVLAVGLALLALAVDVPFVSGVLAGASVACRPDLALLAVLSARRAWQWWVGALCGAAPLLVYVALVGPVAVFKGTIIDPHQSSSYRRLSLAEGDPLFLAVVVGVALVVVWFARRDLPLVGVTLLVVAYGAARIDFPHLTRTAAVVFALLPVVLVGRVRRPFLVAAAVVPFLLVPHLRSSLLDTPAPAREVTVDGRTWWTYQPSDQIAGTVAAVKDLTEPGDRLFVGPAPLTEANYNDTFFYYLLPELEPSGPWLEFNPQNANREGSGLAEQVGRSDVVILSDLYLDEWVGPRSHGSSEPDRVLHEHFEMARRYGPWTVWARR